jgi:23S rRNA pseudouridine1911/1915/1917 synthase
MEQREFIVEAEAAGQRIDRFLSGEDTGLSRSALQGLVAEGHVLCNGKSIAKSLKLKAGDTILLEIPDAKPIEAVPQDIPLDIVYEDDHLLVVNKPKGMVVHPAPGNPDGTLVNALLWHCKGSLSGIGGEIRPGIVHRIDKDTSGLVLAAKNAYAAPLLAGGVAKLYYAIAQGALPLGEGVIDAPIGRRGDSIIGRCVTPEGKPSRTEYTIIKEENGLSLAACVPVTGRTHQIRVHFASIGHPLAGDDLYGGSRERIGRHALHCARQSFTVPVYTPLPDGIRVEMPLQLRTVTVESPLPPDMEGLFS